MTTSPTAPAGATGTLAHPLVRIEGVSRRFGDVVALDEVSLEIAENEFFALLGPSGCGKTTLLRVLAGFEQPDSGRVLLGEDDLLGSPPNRRPVNLMFQSYALFPHMSVERNIAYGLEREGRPKAEIRHRVDEVLVTVGLSGLAKRRPSQLSGGQCQRVALARAIVKRPRLLLLDEPLSALDRKVRAEMQLELKRLQHEVGITFVVVTHDQEEAMSMADRIAVMADGRVQQIAAPIDLYQRPVNFFVADFIGTSNVFTGVAAEGGLRVGDRVLPGRAVNGPVTGPARLVVRPEDTTLVEESQSLVSGRVLETQFYGGVSTVAIVVEGLSEPLLHTRPGVPEAHRDAIVHLAWDPDKAVLLEGTS